MTMYVKDVMGKVAIAVQQDASFADMVEAMRRFKVGAVAVIDVDRRPVGVVSEDDLLLKEIDVNQHGHNVFETIKRRREHDKAQGTTAVDVMTSPAITVTGETPVREAARLMHQHKIKQLPVIDVVTGRITGTVHQSDLLKVFTRFAGDILAEAEQAASKMCLNPADLSIEVERGVVSLKGQIARHSQIAQLTEHIRRIEGVVEVKADLKFAHDDLAYVPPLYL